MWRRVIEMTNDDAERCDRCGEQRETDTLYRNGQVWAAVCTSCHDVLAEEIANPSSGEGGQQTPVEEWEKHKESFKYEPPEKPADAWSSEEHLELYDRVIRRQVQWICDECTGRGPIRSLGKARRHVESHHGGDLVEKYAPPREEQETVTDGGTSKSQVAERQEENQSLSEFGLSSTDTEQEADDGE